MSRPGAVPRNSTRSCTPRRSAREFGRPAARCLRPRGGVNSFGTVSDNGTDSAFYFAISMRELARFLQQNGVQAHASDLPCTSIADLDRAESERAAPIRRARPPKPRPSRMPAPALELARRQAEIAVLTQRDNGMAIAVLLLVATLGAGAPRSSMPSATMPAPRAAGGGALVLLLGTVAAWALRPSLQSIDSRAEDIVAASATPAHRVAPPRTARRAGKFICVLDPQRSRVTVSDITDVPINGARTAA
jgi:hypothetical protein